MDLRDDENYNHLFACYGDIFGLNPGFSNYDLFSLAHNVLGLQSA